MDDLTSYHRHVLKPTRPVPRVGARARVVRFGGGSDGAVVTAIADGGRRLLVQRDGGEELEFVLSPSTAKFVGTGRERGSRLTLPAA